jgi:ATP-dependent DNA helicase RecG
MQNFKNPNGTEVGVNVPDATIMVIENSERFGLSQLHQLRGRIGRGDKKSTCVLLFGSNVTPIAKQRLIAMKETQDGFVLAEEDLKLRGAGEILGTKQSGFPRFKVADYGNDKELFYAAKDDVKMILHKDPYLQTDRGRALRCLLKLFGKDKDLINIIAG